MIAVATLIFVGLGAMAHVSHMDIQAGWLGLFAAALAAVLAAGGIALWRATRFS